MTFKWNIESLTSGFAKKNRGKIMYYERDCPEHTLETFAIRAYDPHGPNCEVRGEAYEDDGTIVIKGYQVLGR